MNKRDTALNRSQRHIYRNVILKCEEFDVLQRAGVAVDVRLLLNAAEYDIVNISGATTNVITKSWGEETVGK